MRDKDIYSSGITCESHFPQKVLDLRCNTEFVQVQADKKDCTDFQKKYQVYHLEVTPNGKSKWRMND